MTWMTCSAAAHSPFKFEAFNDICRGVVESIESRQQTDFDGKPLTWPDGRERKIIVITLSTKESDVPRSGSNDDGKRTLWAKGGRYEVAKGEGTSMRDAIVQAARDAGVSTTEGMIGGELAVGYTGEGKPTQRGYQAPKLYTAAFKAPAAKPAASDLFGDPEPDPF